MLSGFFRISLYYTLLLFFCVNHLALLAQENSVPGELIIWVDSQERWGALEKVAVGYTPDGDPIYPRVVRFLSPNTPVALVHFPPEMVAADRALKVLSIQQGVSLIQFNHYIESRETEQIFPNDTEFLGQWALNNEGQTGGKTDADIDAPEAWEKSTGGLAATGDRIVVAVVDDGFHLDHPDLSFWENEDEIPDNGLDDDGNGYIDDAVGWNAFQQNGIIEIDNHGTQVVGIIGAIGNNNLGITGVNWEVDLMPIVGASLTESIVVESYLYVLNERRLYNQTGGRQGSFVVVLNSSFGVDKGRPEDFPIWCELYDAMGQEGIICPVAVVNSNIDVGEEGDIPTLCDSEFIISVNSTDFEDLRSSSGFSTEFVDLAAPGSSILTTSGNSSYRRVSGTSFSTPFVSGLASLLAAGACPSWMVMYKNNPALGASMLKEWILAGVDTLPVLQGFTSSGGRVNANNSMALLDDFCANLAGCAPPFEAVVSSLKDTSVIISWDALVSTESFVIEYGAGETLSTSVSLTDNSINIGELDPCTQYSFRLASICGTDTSQWGPTMPFTTEGCCSPPEEVAVISVEENSLSLGWRAEFGAEGYSLRYRIQEATNSSWQTLSTPDTMASIQGLENCMAYELQLATLCDTGLSTYGPVFAAQTSGCSFCEDQPYCEFSGQNSTQDWIGRISIDTFTNVSENNNGYGNFTTMMSIPLVAGEKYPFILQPDFSGVRFDERWFVWLDVNQDGLFEGENELLFQNPVPLSATIQDTFQIPQQIIPGITRLRVVMRFDESLTTCGSFRFGEVEDYCVDLQFTTSNQSQLAASAFDIFPNPTQGKLSIRSLYPLVRATVMDIQGRELLEEDYSKEVETEVDISMLPAGYYFLSLTTSEGVGVKKIALQK
ncbi:MAG: S8 family serine peptidase [Bacteroidota bacterium]